MENSGMESCCISFRLYHMSKQVNHVKNGLETLHGNWTSSLKSFFNHLFLVKLTSLIHAGHKEVTLVNNSNNGLAILLSLREV